MDEARPAVEKGSIIQYENRSGRTFNVRNIQTDKWVVRGVEILVE
jgi:hypothetical protein